MNYYTSDLHFGHENIIRLCNRPFNNAEEMNEKIIENFNNRIEKDDVLLILGDVSDFKTNPVPFLKELHGKKVLIAGNHDKYRVNHDKDFRNCFVDIRENELLTDSGYDLFLSHYPMAEWDGFFKGRYQFYGHIHNSKKGAGALMQLLPTAINVGVDVQAFIPKTAFELIEKRIYTKVDCSMEEFLEKTTFVKVDNRAKKCLDTLKFR